MILRGYLWLSDGHPSLGQYFLSGSSVNYPENSPLGMHMVLDIGGEDSIGHKLAIETKDIAAAIFPEEEIVEDSKNVE